MKSLFDHTFRMMFAITTVATLMSGCFLIPEKPEPDGLEALYPINGVKMKPYPITFSWANATSIDRKILVYREDLVNPIWDQSISGTSYQYPFPLVEGYQYRWVVEDGNVAVGGEFEVGYVMERYAKEYQVNVINTPLGGMPDTLFVPIKIAFDKDSNQVTVDIDNGRAFSLPLTPRYLFDQTVSYNYSGNVINHGCDFRLSYEEDSLYMSLFDGTGFFAIQDKLR
jgi:hypothetical protein